MTKRLFLICIFLLSLVSPATGAQEDGFRIDAGPNRVIIAGEPVALSAGGEADACIWTVIEPVPRFRDEDTGRILGETCEITIPGDFTRARVGLWTVEVTAESSAGETASDRVTLRVAPDTANNLVVGYIVIFGIIALYIGWMAWKFRSLRRQKAILEALAEEK